MADTFTSLLRLVLQETGGNQNVWGDINNASLVQLLETAVAGRVAVDVTVGDVVLTTVNGATDQARNAMLAVIGNPGVARNVTVPSTSKLYMVSNETSPVFDVTIKTSAGSGVVIPGGSVVMVYVDPNADETFIVGSTALQATEDQAGIAELATQAEVDAGSDDTRIVTAFKLANATSLLQATETQKGALEIATQAEVDAGADAIRAITPATLSAFPSVDSQLKRCTTDTTAVNDTLVDITGLTAFTVESGEFYLIRGFLSVNPGSGAGGFRVKLNVDNAFADGAIRYERVDDSASVFSDHNDDASAEQTMSITANRHAGIEIKGWCEGHASLVGAVDLQMAQQITDASATTVFVGSWLEVRKIP